ncbi:MAG: oxidoreductase [Bryobacteraceae bacterium]|jgi:NAD(P)-dependent dehydrogenase (short-subunit alcohol dehydrogenase family)
MAKWTVADIPSQQGKLAVVTGGNSGIGWHTALELARAGGEVILTARSEVKGRDAAERIRRQVPKAKVQFEILDLASLRSVRAFAAKIVGEAKLDLLVNNAGVMMVPRRHLTEDGFEIQFGTNFLGPFALTGLLMPVLLRATAPRVTMVTSGAANMGIKRINFDDLQWEKSYGPWKSYCQSKLADLLFAQELARRSAAAGVNLLSNAAYPGYARTNLQRSGPERPTISLPERIFAGIMSQDAAHGALPTLRAATALDAAAGSYYAPDGIFHAKGDPVLIPIPKPAEDMAAARRLWQISEDLTGVEFKSVGSTAGAAHYTTGSLEEDWRARSLRTKRSEG